MKIKNPLPYQVPRHDGAFNFPRRACIDQLTPAEKLIYDAIVAIEKLDGADKLLTDAQVLLGEAQGKLADWLEGKEG